MTRDHFNTNDDESFENGETHHVPSIGDAVTRWRYTLAPTLYTDESSDTNELLWQQILETRAVRAWLVVLALAACVTLPLALIVAGLLLHNTAP